MSENMLLFVEFEIIEAVKCLLTERVNEILGELQTIVPTLEFGSFAGNSVVVPLVAVSGCERTEKERIISLSAYSVTVSFALPDAPESELFCYAYSAAFGKALAENPTLCGVVERAVIVGKNYYPPKKADCGQGWELRVVLRVTVEENGNAG